jgi:anti-sigma regulatory factor (Ser/Thr protein kinase)
VTVKAVDATTVRAQRIINATLPDITPNDTIQSGTFPATPDQVARLREVIKEALAGHPSLDTMVMLASELAANAVRHSGSAFFGLVISRRAERGLRLAVFDEARSGFPRLGEASVEATSGRGLQLLDKIADRWGITRSPGTGIAVWFDAD